MNSVSELAGNLARFAALLRRAGISIGTGQVLDSVRALAAVGVERRGDVFWALHATLIRRREDHPLFAEAFELFFRDPYALSQTLAMLLPMTKFPDPSIKRSRRLDEAHGSQRNRPAQPAKPKSELIEISVVPSDIELDRRLDFEQMSAAEIAAANRSIARLPLIWKLKNTRRLGPNPRGTRVDRRRSLRQSATAPGSICLVYAAPKKNPSPLVILLDVSESMERYSRIFLHFAHAVTNARSRVHTFVFGTKLTNVTRSLRDRDIDHALANVANRTCGARGGTRIATSLHAFNRDWARRTLGSRARVLLFSDGLERDGEYSLDFEADRLRRSAGQLTWLNPLLRYRGFQPRAVGIRALLPHVDDFLPIHNLQSLVDLTAALAE